MKKLCLILLVSVSFNLCAQKNKSSSIRWNNNINSEDALPADQYSFFSKGNLYYSISNDKDNLVMDIKVEDAGTQTRILKYGLYVWINLEGKQQTITGLKFPVGSELPMRPDMKQVASQTENASNFSSSPLTKATIIEVNGFPKAGARYVPAKNTDNFRGKVHYDQDGNLIYKLIMPFDKLDIIPGNTPEFAVAIELGSESPMGMRPGGGGAPMGAGGSAPAGGPPAGGRASGGGGRPGGSAGGSGTPPPVPGGARASDAPINWIKSVKLAPAN